ncbi:MAG: HAMP domain-containing histidine kinase [Lachnospiraceae bacterium]|nr:HAMP domain-containing histidine kinase [Lachnospiraceae bacterium]
MNMIRKLQRRLIGISMASLALVLLVIMGTTNILNYRRAVTRADMTLDLLLQYDGVFPEFRRDEHQEPPAAPDGTGFRPDDSARDDDREPDDDDDDDDYDDRTDMRGMGRRDGDFSRELPYTSRYFTVIYEETSQEPVINIDRILSVDEETAKEYAAGALESGKTRGFIDSYRYAVKQNDGSTIVVFLDCEETLQTFRSFLLTTALISLGGMVAVFLLMLLFSRRIVRPFIDNYEKQKRFITDAGHEIKTPITVIHADTEILEMDLGEDNEWLKDIQAQTSKLKSLTDDLVMLSRMEEAGRELQMIEFPFSDVVSETAGSFKAPALTQGKQFSLEIPPMISFTGDEKAIRQLVSILLDNAVKYCPEGGKISLRAEYTPRALTLTAENTSAPVDPDSLKHIFDRFYRLDSSRNSQTGGYGIGLSIARAIVEAHKGTIKATTRDGSSVTITAAFPVK